MSSEEEILLYREMITDLKESKWVTADTVIVNCLPQSSSIMCQYINKAFSTSEGLDQVDLHLPQDGWSQVWNRELGEYQFFDNYLKLWVSDNIKKSHSYLFLSLYDTSHLYKVMLSIRSKAGDYRFGTIFNTTSWEPEFFVKKTRKPIMEWEK